MKRIGKILCVVDPTAKTQYAVKRAAWLAKATGAELELLISSYNEIFGSNSHFDLPLLEEARHAVLSQNRMYLEDLAEPIRNSGLTVSTAANWDRPLYEGIVRHAIRCDADIVFKDTHQHPAISRAVLTNTDWNIVRTCPTPIWLVKPIEFAADPKLMAAIDPLKQFDKPATLDDDILTISKYLAKEVNGEVHAFHSFDSRIAIATDSSSSSIPASQSFSEFEGRMKNFRRQAFEKVTRSHQIADDHAHIVAGLTEVELPRFAKELGASVVVMGAVARSRLNRPFIGATLERTLEHLPCDLLAIKPDGFISPVEIRDEQEF